MIATIATEGPTLGVRALCEALPFPRATYYRHRSPRREWTPRRPRPARALAAAEQHQVLAVLHAPRFADLAATPERFVHRPPQPPAVPSAAWINRPKLGSPEPIRLEPPPTDAPSASRKDDRVPRGHRGPPPDGSVNELLAIGAGERTTDDRSVNSVPLVSQTP